MREAGYFAESPMFDYAVTNDVKGRHPDEDKDELRRLVAMGTLSKWVWLCHCVFGNPFREPTPIPSTVLKWNDETVVKIAQGIYQERHMPQGTFDSGRLAILHDALLDAGCTDEALLTHCRSDGPHVRGCWVIDQILGKK
jgi:hypothetical protein